MTRHKQLILFYLFPLLSVIISLVTHTNYLGSIIFFWALPALALTFFAWNKALKVFIFSLIGTVFLMTLDIIFYATRQWDTVSMFNNRFPGLVSWEDISYFFIFVYLPILFWEHFYEKQTHEHLWKKSMSRLSGALVLFLLVVLSAWAWAPTLIQIPYFYLNATLLLMVIPLLLELRAHPKMGLRFLRIGSYFAYVAILYELSALYLGLWSYPANKFLGWIEISGLRFPIEELFAWILIGVVGVLTWYEYFDDDNR